jgi:hypothetical protein
MTQVRKRSFRSLLCIKTKGKELNEKKNERNKNERNKIDRNKS